MIIRPSSCARLMGCPGSVGMEHNAPPRAESDDAREGTAAHWVAEMILTGQVDCGESLIDRFAPNQVCITADMVEHVNVYIDHIRSRGVHQQMVEFPVDYDLGHGHKVHGTCDAASCVVGDTVYVDDLKYGYGLVESYDNWQLTAYAIGVFMALRPDPPPDRFVMTIVQPRPYHPSGPIRSWTIGWHELNERFNRMAQAAMTAASPNPPLATGSHCRYCDAFTECPASQAAGMNAVDVVCQGTNDTLSSSALSMELTNLNRAKAMIDARLTGLEEMAKMRLQRGDSIPGWNVVRSLGNRRWVKGVDISMIEMLAGMPLTEPKAITPAAAERRGVSEDVIRSMTERPDNGFKLVPFDVDRAAKEAFGNG